MLDERLNRRSDFRPGWPIRLADGRDWSLPGPPARGSQGGVTAGAPVFEPDYEALLEALRDPEDEADRLRCELALAICLLGRNYDLGPDDFDALLDFDDD